MANLFSTDLEQSSSQYWSITNAAQAGLDMTGSWTISAWIKLESAGTNAIFGKWTLPEATMGFLTVTTVDGTVLRTYVTSNGGIVGPSLDDDTDLSLGVWHHVATVYTQGAATVSMYINGVRVVGPSNGSGFPATPSAGTAPVTVGFMDDFLSFDGLINNVLVYDAALDDTAVGLLFSNPCNPSATDLVSWWFADNNNADDLFGPNDLTGINSPTFSADVPFVCAGSGATHNFCLLGVGN